MKETLIFKSLFQSDYIGLGALTKNICYYSKDIESKYIDCNESTANELSLASLKDITGKNDHAFGWSRSRIQFLRQHDLEVMRNQTTSCRLEKPFATPDGKVIQLMSYKSPLYIDNKVAAVAGFSIDVLSLNLTQETKSVDLMNFLKSQFSKRESQVLFQLTRGKSAREISEILGISKRTVEFYLANIKSKLGVKSKSELIEKIIDGFC